MIQFLVGRLDLEGGSLPAPHIREHLVSGEPITVFYRTEQAGNVVTKYIDAMR